MSGANNEPMPFVRKFGGGGGAMIEPAPSMSLRSELPSQAGTTVDSGFVDAAGTAIMRAPVTGACRKCGFAGHLPFQCMNYLQVKPNQEAVLDVSSTSSESEEESSVLQKRAAKIRKTKKEKKEKKSKKTKKTKEEKHKKKRKRKRETTSSSDSSDSDDGAKKRKKHRTSKQKKRRRRRSQSSSSSD